MGTGLTVLVADGIGLLLLLIVLAALACIAVAVRRAFLSRRGGTVELSMRLGRRSLGAGWAAGVARFTAEELQWYRLFSLAPRPRARLSRNDLAIAERRPPNPDELSSLHPDIVVLHCHTPGTGDAEIAMSETTLTGFQSWLEATPPGRLHSSSHSRP